MTFPDTLYRNELTIPEDRALSLNVSLTNACNEGFGVSIFAKFESEVPLTSSTLA